MSIDMISPYDQGYKAYIAGVDYCDNPYLYWDDDGLDSVDGCWHNWNKGWDDAYLQFNRSGGWSKTNLKHY